MLDGIRADMKTPLARPPGRRGVWVRFAPEICAAGVYGVGLAVMLCLSHRFDQAYVIYFDPSESDLMNGIVTAFCLASLVLTVLPTVESLQVWYRDHALGTADALMLTPSLHHRIARGRYWHVVLPWLRFMAWIAPLYAALAVSRFVSKMGSEIGECDGESLLAGGLVVGASKGVFGFLCVVLNGGIRRISAGSLFLVFLRWVCDVKSLLVVTAVGSFLSARVRSAAGMVGACVLLPLAMATALSFPDWVLGLLALIDGLPNVTMREEVVGIIYAPIIVLFVVAEIVLALWAYRSMARNFDAYMTGEKPERA